MPDRKDSFADPFQLMMTNRKEVMAALEKTSTLAEAWEALLRQVPRTAQLIKFNTFKAYARFVHVVDQELAQKVQLQEQAALLQQELEKARQENARLQKELGEVSERQVTDEAEQTVTDEKLSGKAVPKHVDGWGVQRRGVYYRLFKKVDGKLKWIHIGRVWSSELARQKIEAFRG